ncbi:MAG TPA: serine acetyltransferase [Firmicutes bacterium]|nr:serine acetyltransferase [Bacillota bacterium]
MVKQCFNRKLIVEFVEEIEKYFFCDESLEKANKLFSCAICDDKKNRISFFKELPIVKQELKSDLSYFFESDPASDTEEEIVYCYPGYKAITYYRVAHLLYKLNLKLQARIIGEHAHFMTGIDIHPGANIGCPFFIDHGTGIVIGETSIIGDYVKMYQGVTIGALSLRGGRAMKEIKRHPTIGSHVTIYANASILGGDVIIGDNVVIGGNVYLTNSVPDNHKVLNKEPELIVLKK